MGLLFKSAAALERAADVDTAVFDKTGTITEGKPKVRKIVPLAGLDERGILTVMLSMERKSEHPLAKAVEEKATELGISPKEITGFQQRPGLGLSCALNGERYHLGNLRLANELELPTEKAQAEARSLESEGLTVLYLTNEEKVLGLAALGDSLKAGSKAAVNELSAMNVGSVMLTGDNHATAQAVARDAGIQEVLSEVMPQDKEREIRKLQEAGRVPAMVGDGINDAPALARADLGIAIGAGTDIAMDAADVILMRSDPMQVPLAIQLSRAVMRNIRQNLFWAFGYNVIGIPIAAGVLYKAFGITLSPMIAAAAMSLSSVSVVSNALRLRFFKPKFKGATPQDGAYGPAGAKNAGKGPLPGETTKEEDMADKIMLKVDGMTCPHCEARVAKSLEEVPGVKKAKANHKKGTAEVVLEKGAEVDKAALAAKVVEAGYEARPE
jgi:heavy metal translocating P-type ATPase